MSSHTLVKPLHLSKPHNCNSWLYRTKTTGLLAMYNEDTKLDNILMTASYFFTTSSTLPMLSDTNKFGII